VLPLLPAGERGERHFGDLGIADPALPASSQIACGYSTAVHASSSMLAIAAFTLAVIRAVTENQARWRRAVPTIVGAENLCHLAGCSADR
jgi:hypothetical protein